MFKILLFLFSISLNLIVINGVDVRIVHWNDVRGQLDNWMFDETGGTPIDCNESEGVCLSGIARIAKKIEEQRALADARNRQFFNIFTGNLVGGMSGWLTMLENGWEKYGKLLAPKINDDTSNLTPNFISLGIKEFESGETQTRTFVAATEAKILLTTYDGECDICERKRQLLPTYPSPLVLGFMDPTVERLGSIGRFRFKSDVVGALRDEIQLHSTVNSFIAIGSGDRRLAEKILEGNPKIKMVIYSGGSTDLSDYPIRHGNGVILKAGMFGSWLGQIDFTVNNGEIDNMVFSQIPLDLNVPRDEVLKKNVEWMRGNVTEKNKNLARSIVDLKGSKEDCWKKECNLGNLIADSMVHCAYLNISEKIDPGLVAIWHSGAIYKSYVHFDKQITTLDVHKWLPFHNKPVWVRIGGDVLLEMFQRTAPNLDDAPEWGQFLQVSSGLKVTYSEDGKKLLRLQIAKHQSTIPTFEDVNKNEQYDVIIPTFIKNKKGIFEFFPTLGPTAEIKSFDDECVEQFLVGRKIISNGFEQRITFGSQSSGSCPEQKKCKGSNKAVTVILTLVISGIIIGVLFAAYKFVLPRFRNTSRRQF